MTHPPLHAQVPLQPASEQHHEVHHGVLEPHLAASVRALCEQGIQEVVAREQLEPGVVRRLVSAWGSNQPWVREAAGTLAPIVRDHLVERGSEIGHRLSRVIDASLFVMTHEQGRGTHAHQDLAYKWDKPSSTRYAYTTWIALHDCDVNAGALRFCAPFRVGEVSVRQDFLRPDFVDKSTTAEWLSGESIAAVTAGSVVVFDSLTWHGSCACTAAIQRMALAIRWRSTTAWEDQIQLKRPTAAPGAFTMDSSGAVLCRALAGAFGVDLPRAPERGTTLRLLRHVLAHNERAVSRLGQHAQRAVYDLERALGLLERHHARPSPAVWMAVRDVALPAVNELSAGGEA